MAVDKRLEGFLQARCHWFHYESRQTRGMIKECAIIPMMMRSLRNQFWPSSDSLAVRQPPPAKPTASPQLDKVSVPLSGTGRCKQIDASDTSVHMDKHTIAACSEISQEDSQARLSCVADTLFGVAHAQVVHAQIVMCNQT